MARRVGPYLNPALTPNLAYMSILYPPQHRSDNYTFKVFIELFEAYCRLKEWNSRSTKFDVLRFYLTGRAERAYTTVRQFFNDQHDRLYFSFNLFTEHINLLLCAPAPEWDRLLIQCSCEYCYNKHRLQNQAARNPSPTSSPERPRSCRFSSATESSDDSPQSPPPELEENVDSDGSTVFDHAQHLR